MLLFLRIFKNSSELNFWSKLMKCFFFNSGINFIIFVNRFFIESVSFCLEINILLLFSFFDDKNLF